MNRTTKQTMELHYDKKLENDRILREKHGKLLNMTMFMRTEEQKREAFKKFKKEEKNAKIQ